MVENLKLLVETTIKVTVGGVSEYHVFLIAQQLIQECPLGTDLLSQYGCAAACHHTVAGGKKLPLVDRSEEKENS